MSGLDWRSLTVEGERHAAIFAETFPARLADVLAGSAEPAGAIEAFDSTAALEILATFAGAWGAMGRRGRCSPTVVVHARIQQLGGTA